MKKTKSINWTGYDNTNNFNVYITKGGKYKIGNYSFKNKSDIRKCVRCMLNNMKHYKIITDPNIIAFVNDLLTYHPKYESEMKFYINNFDLMVTVNDDYKSTFSNFAFYKLEKGKCYYREFSTNKSVDNIKVINTNKTTNKAKSILKGLGYEPRKANLQNVIETNIDKFVNNVETIDNIEGCYMIEDFYIGRSQNILNRICGHLDETFRLYLYYDKTNNHQKCKSILNILETGDKLNVKVLSNNQEDERRLIIKYAEETNLTNKVFNKYNKPAIVNNKYVENSRYDYVKVETLFEI